MITITLEGDAEESAQIFFDKIIEKNRHLLEPSTQKSNPGSNTNSDSGTERNGDEEEHY